jgi:hypothetical protein
MLHPDEAAAIVYLLFPTFARQMYSGPCVSDRTPNRSAAAYL